MKPLIGHWQVSSRLAALLWNTSGILEANLMGFCGFDGECSWCFETRFESRWAADSVTSIVLDDFCLDKPWCLYNCHFQVKYSKDW